MDANKMNVEVVIQSEQNVWLDKMARKHSLDSTSKALRVLLDYAIEVASEAEIFQEERCRYC